MLSSMLSVEEGDLHSPWRCSLIIETPILSSGPSGAYTARDICRGLTDFTLLACFFFRSRCDAGTRG